MHVQTCLLDNLRIHVVISMLKQQHNFQHFAHCEFKLKKKTQKTLRLKDNCYFVIFLMSAT